MSDSQGTRGAVWWVPVNAEDMVIVDADTLSYEADGELRLCKAIGTVESDGIQETSVPA